MTDAIVDAALSTLVSQDAGAGESSTSRLRVDAYGALHVVQSIAGTAVTAGNQTTSAASTYEDAQSNRDITLLASAARTASINSSDITNVNHRGVTVVIEATAATLTPSVVFTIQGKDAVSGVYYTLLASAAVTGISTTVLRVFPGATAAAGTVANDQLPRVWRISAVAADADSITYSIGASMTV